MMRMSKDSRRRRTLFSSLPATAASSSSSSSSHPWTNIITKVCTYEPSSSSSLFESSSPSPSSQWRRIGRRPYCLKPRSTIVVGYHTSSTPGVKKKIDPNLVRHNKRIHAGAKSGPMPPGLAMELLNEVKRAGLLPDVILYSTLISSCSRWSNFEEGVRIYNHMLASSNCRPNLHIYSTMISLYGRCGMTKEAEKIFKELKSKGLVADVVTYTSLIDAFAKQENVEKVREISEEMAEVGISKNDKTYGTIIQMYSNCGQHDLALKTCHDLVASNCELHLKT